MRKTILSDKGKPKEPCSSQKYWKNTSESHQSGRRRGRRRREEMQAISEGSGVKKEKERELVQSRSGKRLTKLV